MKPTTGWWVEFREGEPNQPAAMGGYVHVATQEELEEVLAWLRDRGASTYIRPCFVLEAYTFTEEEAAYERQMEERIAKRERDLDATEEAVVWGPDHD